MTLLAHRPPSLQPDAEAPIREARRRRRRRWIVGLTVVVAAASVVTAVASGGGGRPIANRGLDGTSAPDARVATAQWQQLQGPGVFSNGATVTTVVRFDGELVASGDVFGPGHLRGLGCIDACSPVVWVSNGKSKWRPVYASQARGGIPGERLIEVGGALLLIDRDEGNGAWRSTDGVHWAPVALPSEMEAMPMTGEASNGSTAVVVTWNKYAGGPGAKVYGNADSAWTTHDGVSWTKSSPSGDPIFSSVATTPSGFVIAGRSTRSQQPAIWTSSDGVRWTESPALGVPAGGVDTVAAGRNGLVLDWVSGVTTPGSKSELWFSRTGASWTQARVSGRLPSHNDGAMPAALAVVGGYVSFGDRNDQLWWSPTGVAWSRVQQRVRPPWYLSPQGAFVAGARIYLIEMVSSKTPVAPFGATSVWTLSLRQGSRP